MYNMCDAGRIVFYALVLCIYMKVQCSVNVAENKPAVQSSTYRESGYGPEKAVDGCKKQNLNDDGCCSHQAEEQDFVSWGVNLTQIYNIESMTIYIRTDWGGSPYRLAGYRIYLSNTSYGTDGQLCYDDTARLPRSPIPLDTEITRTECSGLAQFVTIYNDRKTYVPPNIPPRYENFARTYTVLELCEVQVMGCLPGRFGSNCSQSCTGCINNMCKPSTGECTGCKNGFWGSSCQNNCSFGCDDVKCHQQTGSCSRCKPGFFDTRCSQKCSPNCKGNMCNNSTGRCFDCKSGYYDLNTSCGRKCPEECLKKVCDISSGQCIECPLGKYGSYCRSACSDGCSNGCQQQDGRCIGCKTGLYGDKCDKQCSEYCTNPRCDRNTGSCIGSCKPGRYGVNCTTSCSDHCTERRCERNTGHCSECTKGRYGEMCKKNCPVTCADNTCDQMSGKCKECSQRNYGFNCTNDCQEKCVVCAQDTGECTECEEGYFGEECSESCGFCAGKACHKTLGTCSASTCLDGYEGSKCDKKKQKSNTVIIAVAVVIVILVLIVIAGIIFFLKRRKQSDKPSTPPMLFHNEDVRIQEHPSDHVYVNAQGRQDHQVRSGEEECVYSNTGPFGIAVSDLKDMVEKKMHNEGKELIKEYKALPSGPIHPHTIGSKAGNKSRNRFKSTFPYDHSRVILQTHSVDSTSDYINANYIDSVDELNVYVATQGPIKNTVDDFWRMVWQLNAGKIVMLTNLKEGEKVKCEKYWPDIEKSLTTKSFDIALGRENTYAFYVLREFSVTQKQTNECRKIVQFHFVTWPDHGTPDTSEFITFHRRVKTYESKLVGPYVVHCSAGIGRTGTFIALDALLDYGRKSGRIDIKDYVTTMRKNRVNMVQTQEQYICLHEALVEAFSMDDTLIRKPEFCERFRNLVAQEQTPTNQSMLRKEFMRLESLVPKYDSTAYFSANEESNKNKNRTMGALAADRFRVYLKNNSPTENDYINAVILQSHTARTGFLITQFPLPDTVTDFWRMVKDHRSPTIVVLGSYQDVNQPPQWIPEEEGTLSVGEFVITLRDQSQDNSTAIRSLELCIVNKLEHYEDEIQVFQLKSWAPDVPVPRKNIILRFMSVVANSSRQNTNRPVIVMCRDGTSQSGLYCLLATTKQQIAMDAEVDVFQASKQIRTRRPECLSSFDQYQFAYTAIQDYVENSDVYVNT